MSKKETFYCWVEAPPNGRPESTGVKRGGEIRYHPLAKTTRCALVRWVPSFEELEKQMNLLYPQRNKEPQWGLLTSDQINKLKAFYEVASNNIVVTRRR